MKKLNKNQAVKYISITLILALLSCSKSEDFTKTVAKAIQPIDTLTVSKVVETSGESMLFNPRAILNLGDEKLVIYDFVNEDFFKVFSLPDLQFLNKFGMISRGPEADEFPSQFFNLNSDEVNLIVFEGISRQLRTLRVTNSGVEKISETRLTSTHFRQAMNHVRRMTDSLYFVDFGTTPGEGVSEHIALQPGNSDSLFTFGSYPDTELDDDARHFEFVKMNTSNSDGSRFAAFYFNHNRFKIYNEAGSLLNEVFVDDPFLKEMTTSEGETISFRTAVKSTGEYIYTIGNLGIDWLQTLEIWSWDGQQVFRAYLDREIRDFTISQKQGKIYAISTAEESKLYEYEIPELTGF